MIGKVIGVLLTVVLLFLLAQYTFDNTIIVNNNDKEKTLGRPVIIFSEPKVEEVVPEEMTPIDSPTPSNKVEAKDSSPSKFEAPLPPVDKVDEINRLLTSLESTDHDVRIRAERHLIALGDVVISAAIQHKNSDKWLVRCAVLRILTSTNHPSIISTLLEMLADKEDVVASVAQESLRKVSGLSLRSSTSIEEWEMALKAIDLLPPM